MNKSEAQKILGVQLARFSSRSHLELASLVESRHVEAYEVRGTSGTACQVEIQFFWDAKPGDTIRVMGSLDDGGIRAFAHLDTAPKGKQAGGRRLRRFIVRRAKGNRFDNAVRTLKRPKGRAPGQCADAPPLR